LHKFWLQEVATRITTTRGVVAALVEASMKLHFICFWIHFFLVAISLHLSFWLILNNQQ